MIILGIADADHFVGREAEPAQRTVHAARLVDTRRQHHNRIFVEDDLKPRHFLNRLEHGGMVRQKSADDDLADVDQVPSQLAQTLDKLCRRRLAEKRLLERFWVVEDRSILRHDIVE